MTNRLKQKLILIALVSVIGYQSTICFGQDKDSKRTPNEQIPVQERDTGDSFIENLGELPGKIVTLPFQLFFHGVSKTARWMDLSGVYLRTTDLLTSEDETRRVRPIFTPSGGGGVTYSKDNFFNKPGMDFRGHFSFGNRSRRLFSTAIMAPGFFTERFGFDMLGLLERKPDVDFFGLGNDAPKEDETNYLHNERRVAGHLLYLPTMSTRFSVGLAYSDLSIEPGRDPHKPSLDSLFTPQDVPGFHGAKLWSLAIKVYSDTRNRLGHPTRGGEAYFAYEFADQISGSEHGFRKFTADVRRYVHLFHRRVLALRFASEVTDAQEGKQIPFYRLAGLGGADDLRGYRPVRFRDADMMLVGAEYRFPIHPVVFTTFFLDQGRVFSDIFEDFTLSGWRYSYGGGLRVAAQDGGFVAKIEIAKSAEQTRLLFSLNTDLRRF